MEKEDLLHQLQETCATLKDELTVTQSTNHTLNDDICRCEAARETAIKQLVVANEATLELEATLAAVSAENTRLIEEINGKEKEISRLKKAEVLLETTKSESENYQKIYMVIAQTPMVRFGRN